jgi:hypothetical protein
MRIDALKTHRRDQFIGANSFCLISNHQLQKIQMVFCADTVGGQVDSTLLTVHRMDQRAAGSTFRVVFSTHWSLRDEE